MFQLCEKISVHTFRDGSGSVLCNLSSGQTIAVHCGMEKLRTEATDKKIRALQATLVRADFIKLLKE